MALFKWDDLVFTHISARVPGTHDEFLINPYGLMFDEITASSLIKIDAQGNKLDASPYDCQPGRLHHPQRDPLGAPRRAVRAAHPLAERHRGVGAEGRGAAALAAFDLRAVELGYHDYEGVALRDDEKPRLVADLGAERTTS